jgi:hypothetical protein
MMRDEYHSSLHLIMLSVLESSMLIRSAKRASRLGSPVGRVCETYTLQDIFQHHNLLNGKPQPKAIVALAAFAGLRKGELRGLMSIDDPGENIANSAERVAQRREGTAQDRIVGDRAGASYDPSHRAIAGDLGCHHAAQLGLDDSQPVWRCWTWTILRLVSSSLCSRRLACRGTDGRPPSRGLSSNLKALGVDDMMIQRILRHEDVSTTQRNYIHVRE